MSLFSSHPEDGELAAYVDGGLPAGDALRIAAHLAWCGTCRSDVEIARAIVHGEGDGAPDDAPSKASQR